MLLDYACPNTVNLLFLILFCFIIIILDTPFIFDDRERKVVHLDGKGGEIDLKGDRGEKVKSQNILYENNLFSSKKK